MMYFSLLFSHSFSPYFFGEAFRPLPFIEICASYKVYPIKISITVLQDIALSSF